MRRSNGGCLGLVVLVSLVVGVASLLGIDTGPKTTAPARTAPSLTEEVSDSHSPFFRRLERAAKHLPPGASYEAIVAQAQLEASP